MPKFTKAIENNQALISVVISKDETQFKHITDSEHSFFISRYTSC